MITSTTPRCGERVACTPRRPSARRRDEVAVIVTITRRAPTTRSIAPPTPSTSCPGTAQLAMSPCSAHLERAEHGDVDVAAADHGEARRAVEVRRARQRGHRLLGGVDQVGVDVVRAPGAGRRRGGRSRYGGTPRVVAEHARDEVRDADAEVDDLARAELVRGPRRDRATWTSAGSALMPAPRDSRRRDGASRPTRARARPPGRSRPPRRS